MAAPTVVQHKSATVTSGTSLSVTLNAAPTSGNLLVAFGADPSGQVGLAAGTGWTALDSATDAFSYVYFISAYKVAGASESATQTPFKWSLSHDPGIVVVYEISGQASSGFIDAHGISAVSATPSLTLSPANADLALVELFAQSSSAVPTSTTPTGYTQDEHVTYSSTTAVYAWENGSAASGSQTISPTLSGSSPTGILLGVFVTAGGAPASRTGTLSVTLGAATITGRTTDPVQATVAPTLGALSLSGVARDPVQATATPTLPLSLTGTGLVYHNAQVALSLAALALTGLASNIDHATLGTTLGALTASTGGTVTEHGNLTRTLGLSLSASGGSGHEAVVQQTLALTPTAQGAILDRGSLGLLLNTLGASATGTVKGTVPIQASLSVVLDALAIGAHLDDMTKVEMATEALQIASSIQARTITGQADKPRDLTIDLCAAIILLAQAVLDNGGGPQSIAQVYQNANYSPNIATNTRGLD